MTATNQKASLAFSDLNIKDLIQENFVFPVEARVPSDNIIQMSVGIGAGIAVGGIIVILVFKYLL